MTEAQHWNEQEGICWIERYGLRLVVRLPSAKGYFRFVVIYHRDPNHCPDRLLGSETHKDVGKAMNAAERMAERLGYTQAIRHHSGTEARPREKTLNAGHFECAFLSVLSVRSSG
jgi:hypothetical protein